MADTDEDIDSRLRGEYPTQRRKRDKDSGDDEESSPVGRKGSAFQRFRERFIQAVTVLGTGFIVWMAHTTFTMAGDVKVLLARPEPVPMSQYNSDQAQLQRQLDDLKKQLDKLRP